VRQAVVVEARHERLARVRDDVARKRQPRDRGVRAVVEVEAALVAQLVRDLRLALLHTEAE
jgi:hypothetical protein